MCIDGSAPHRHLSCAGVICFTAPLPPASPLPVQYLPMLCCFSANLPPLPPANTYPHLLISLPPLHPYQPLPPTRVSSSTLPPFPPQPSLASAHILERILVLSDHYPACQVVNGLVGSYWGHVRSGGVIKEIYSMARAIKGYTRCSVSGARSFWVRVGQMGNFFN